MLEKFSENVFLFWFYRYINYWKLAVTCFSSLLLTFPSKKLRKKNGREKYIFSPLFIYSALFKTMNIIFLAQKHTQVNELQFFLNIHNFSEVNSLYWIEVYIARPQRRTFQFKGKKLGTICITKHYFWVYVCLTT